MDLKIVYDPLPKQRELHNATEPYVAYIGGVGSGKTYCGSQEFLRRAVSEPRYILIGAPTYPLLRDTTRKEFLDNCPPELIYRLNKTDNELTLRANGGFTTIVFRTLENPLSLKNYNLSDFWMDEGSEAPEESFLMLQSRLRRPGVSSYKGIITTNPNGRDWMWRRFVDKKDPNYKFIHAPTNENTHLPEGYLERLLASYPEFWVKRYLNADFNVFEGQIYTLFDEFTHVIEPFDIPPGWDKLLSIDHGMHNPTAILAGAVDHDGNLFIFDEYYSPGLVSSHAAYLMTRFGDDIEAGRIATPVIDPNSANVRNAINGKSIAEEYLDHGVYVTPGNDHVIAGINRISEMLKIDPTRYHPLTGRQGSPKLFIFKNCVNLIREFPLYRWDKISFINGKDPIEKPHKANDHCFIKGTPILTRDGYQPVEEIKQGDEVWSPFGWNKVLRAGLSGRQEDVKDYGVFTATPNHKVATQRGFVELDALRYTDKLFIWHKAKEWSFKEFLTAVTRTPKIGLIGITFGALLTKSLKTKQDFYIEMYGNSIKALFLTVTSSIMLMVILGITTLVILLYSLISNMLSNITGGNLQKFLRRYDHSQNYGMLLQKEESGTLSTVRKRGKRGNPFLGPATSVEYPTEPNFLREANSVIRTVGQTHVANVYNLQTEFGFYFANGVLVSNCLDSLRYLVTQRFGSADIKTRAPAGSYQALLNQLDAERIDEDIIGNE